MQHEKQVSFNLNGKHKAEVCMGRSVLTPERASYSCYRNSGDHPFHVFDFITFTLVGPCIRYIFMLRIYSNSWKLECYCIRLKLLYYGNICGCFFCASIQLNVLQHLQVQFSCPLIKVFDFTGCAAIHSTCIAQSISVVKVGVYEIHIDHDNRDILSILSLPLFSLLLLLF